MRGAIKIPPQVLSSIDLDHQSSCRPTPSRCLNLTPLRDDDTSSVIAEFRVRPVVMRLDKSAKTANGPRQRAGGRPVVAGEGHSAGEQQNERMDIGGGQVGGKLVWPTREELFREPPPPPECDICSLPMGSNSGKRSIEGSAAISLVSRYFVPCLASCDSIPRLTQCLPKVLLRKADLPRVSLLELDCAWESMLSILSRTIYRCRKREEKYGQARKSEERSALHTAR